MLEHPKLIYGSLLMESSGGTKIGAEILATLQMNAILSSLHRGFRREGPGVYLVPMLSSRQVLFQKGEGTAYRAQAAFRFHSLTLDLVVWNYLLALPTPACRLAVY